MCYNSFPNHFLCGHVNCVHATWACVCVINGRETKKSTGFLEYPTYCERIVFLTFFHWLHAKLYSAESNTHIAIFHIINAICLGTHVLYDVIIDSWRGILFGYSHFSDTIVVISKQTHYFTMKNTFSFAFL